CRNSYKNFDWIALIRNRFFNLWVRLCFLGGGGGIGGKTRENFLYQKNILFAIEILGVIL
ncbi:hypothetical protein JWG44_15735, partial [Leptospira sp. 201903071]|uniref:hypothetical protein n=1 Tax=Leptospira ainazelensis TaxID=2810034 RepID=UPI001964564F